MTSILTHDGTIVDDNWVGSNKNSDGGSRKLNAYDPQLQETGQGSDLLRPHQGANKRHRITGIRPRVYYLEEMKVESVEAAEEHIQEAWSAIDRLTKDLGKCNQYHTRVQRNAMQD